MSFQKERFIGVGDVLLYAGVILIFFGIFTVHPLPFIFMGIGLATTVGGTFKLARDADPRGMKEFWE